MMNEEEYQLSLNHSLNHGFAPEATFGGAAQHDVSGSGEQELSPVGEQESPLTTQTESRASEKSPNNVAEGTATPKGPADRKNLMMQLNNAAGAATAKAGNKKRVDFVPAEDNSEMIF